MHAMSQKWQSQPSWRSAVLFLEGYEAEIAVACCRDARHHLPDGAIVRRFVAAHIDAFVITGGSDRLELGDDFFQRDFRLLKIYLALTVHGNRDRLRFGVERVRLGFRKIDRHADRQKRSRHHENDQQHEHDVDEWGDVDLRYQGFTPPAPAAAPTSRLPGYGHPHYAYSSARAFGETFSSICRDNMAENSSAKPSIREAMLFASDESLL